MAQGGKTRVILELVSDCTKAALRAVADALHHSSLAFIRLLKIDKTRLDVEVTIGVQRPDLVKIKEINAVLPVGNPTV
jgi:ribulose bisphosphate carboxylase small subunit